MNFLFACGGTAGHINPALAVAGRLRELMPDCGILFVGADFNMEQDLVPRSGYDIITLRVNSLRRSRSPKAMCHNVKALVNVFRGKHKAKKILRSFAPDVVLGTGGYVCYPVLKAASELGIPTAVHESNAVPGLTTRMVEKNVTRIMVSFPESRGQYSDPDSVVVTGTPVRESFLYTNRAEARAALGLGDEPLIVSCWGSLGAREMNKKIARFMKREQDDGTPYRHIHATGSFGWRWMPEYVKEQGVDLKSHPRLDMREYIYDMPQVMAAADLIICRAGAATIAEVCASATPCIMVPSPNVTDNHQEKNARVLEKNGAAVVIRENECDGDSLYEAAKQLLSDRERCRAMRSAAANLAVVDAAERIYQTALELSRH